MFSLFGASYGFLSPLFLIGLPIVLGGLVFAYLRGGKRNVIQVSSLLLLKQLVQSRPARKKFWPPPRFFIELLVLSLLILAASGLYSGGYEGKVAIIIDNSQSMKARLSLGQTRFELAKEDAISSLNTLASSTGIDLYSTSPQLKKILDRTLSLNEAERELENISTTNFKDALAQNLNTVLRQAEYEEVLLFTDKKLAPESDPDSIVKIKGREEIFQPLENISLSTASIQPKGLSDKNVDLQIQISSFTKENTEVDIIVDGIFLPKTETLSPLQRKSFTIPANKLEFLTIKVPKADAYQIEIKQKNSLPYSIQDSLLEDNKLFLINKIQQSKAALISESSPKALSLDRIKSFSFDGLSIDEYEKLSSTNKNSYSLLIFHRETPLELPETNSLFVLPVSDAEFFSVESALGASDKNRTFEVSNWNQSHSLTAYLNLPLLELKSAFILRPKKTGKGIISTTRGDIFVAASTNSGRYAASGFEIFPFRGKKSPILSILTLNTLKWISQASLSKQLQAPPLKIDSKITSIQKLFNDKRNYSISEIIWDNGLYLTSLNDEQDKLSSIYYYDANESNLLAEHSIIAPKHKANIVSNSSDESQLASKIIWWILALILFDLLSRSIIRRRRIA